MKNLFRSDRAAALPLAAMWRPCAAVAAACALAQTAAAAGFRAAPVADYREDDFSFGVSAGAAFVGGEAREHSFSPKSESFKYAQDLNRPDDHRRHRISRLDWDVAATMVGLSGSARYDRLSLNGGVWYGGSGSDDYDMDDYDWLAGDHRRHTHHSRSEVELTDAWMFDANLSCDFWRTEGSAGYVFGGLREQRWKWTQDGLTEYWYPFNDGGRFRDRGHGIDYRQVFLMAYVGLGGDWKLTDSLTLSAYASWAPRYAGRDRDNHIDAEKLFHGNFDWDDGEVYAAGVALGFQFAPRRSLCVALDWQRATLHEGRMFAEDLESGETMSAKGAAGFESEYVALSFTLDCAF